MPGVRLNFGKRGTSVSLGGRGATMNLSKKGVRQTVGIPGTGMSYTDYKSWDGASNAQASNEQATPAARSSSLGWLVTIAVIVLIAWLAN